MAETSTSAPHWIAYGGLVVALGVVLWVWHETQVHDAQVLQTLIAAKQNQTQVDSKAAQAVSTAQQKLRQQNNVLQEQRAAAKTVDQEAKLVNSGAGTTIDIQHQAPNSLPSEPLVVVSNADLGRLADVVTARAELQNQVAADAIQIASDKQQIEARDGTIDAQGKEITALKGGGRVKRFLHGLKVVGISAGTGVVIGIIAEKNGL